MLCHSEVSLRVSQVCCKGTAVRAVLLPRMSARAVRPRVLCSRLAYRASIVPASLANPVWQSSSWVMRGRAGKSHHSRSQKCPAIKPHTRCSVSE
ncbi:hypothetical protein IG631_15094 [Alternaria alternata]|nr:hypothetical protein IG631_15094 [Alternaria alternata]